MYSQTWHLEQNGRRLDKVIFVLKRDAIEYADENLEGEYELVKEHHLKGETRQLMKTKQKEEQ